MTSFTKLAELKTTKIKTPSGELVEFVKKVRDVLNQFSTGTNEGELAAFISYAQSFPDDFLALVDTYDTLQSGIPNFIAVSVVLFRLGYQPFGIRLDSGDLAYQSKVAREMFVKVTLSRCCFLCVSLDPSLMYLWRKSRLWQVIASLRRYCTH